MKINAAPRILAVAAVCAAGLIGLVVSEGFARQGGQEVMLPMEAVDPRALLSGHYVQINLAQRLEAPQTCPQRAEHDEWVALRQDGQRYVAVGAAASREEAQLLGLPVKGSFICSEPTPASDTTAAFPGLLTLDVGVERFHINQTDAERIDRALQLQNADANSLAFAVVSIGRDGRARLRGLVVDGQRHDLNWL